VAEDRKKRERKKKDAINELDPSQPSNLATPVRSLPRRTTCHVPALPSFDTILPLPSKSGTVIIGRFVPQGRPPHQSQWPQPSIGEIGETVRMYPLCQVCMPRPGVWLSLCSEANKGRPGDWAKISPCHDALHHLCKQTNFLFPSS